MILFFSCCFWCIRHGPSLKCVYNHFVTRTGELFQPRLYGIRVASLIKSLVQAVLTKVTYLLAFELRSFPPHCYLTALIPGQLGERVGCLKDWVLYDHFKISCPVLLRNPPTSSVNKDYIRCINVAGKPPLASLYVDLLLNASFVFLINHNRERK